MKTTKVVNINKINNVNKGVNKKSILIGGGRLSVGGVETHLRILCKILRSADVEVTLAATGSDWSFETIKEIQALGVRFLLPPKLFASYRHLNTLHSLITLPFHLRKRYFNALYCIGAGRSHQYLRKLVEPETVGIYHEIVSGFNPTSVEAQCAVSLGTIIANSDKVGHEITKFLPNVPLCVLPFLTSEAPSPIPPDRQPIGSREIRVVYLGRLVPHKRPDQLVREWSTISNLHPLSPARLDVFGSDNDPTLLNELRQFVVEKNLNNQIKLHGSYKTQDLSYILAQADLVVLPSLLEGLPLVLVEAMQRGVPIVATAAGGIEELGKNNPDIIITNVEWSSFVNGLLSMSQKLRSGQIDSTRLYQWTESRYGYKAVSKMWLDALLNPREFFRINETA
jgi:glycosyltransferase involved in cell wall biosynthesis